MKTGTQSFFEFDTAAGKDLCGCLMTPGGEEPPSCHLSSPKGPCDPDAHLSVSPNDGNASLGSFIEGYVRVELVWVDY